MTCDKQNCQATIEVRSSQKYSMLLAFAVTGLCAAASWLAWPEEACATVLALVMGLMLVMMVALGSARKQRIRLTVQSILIQELFFKKEIPADSIQCFTRGFDVDHGPAIMIKAKSGKDVYTIQSPYIYNEDDYTRVRDLLREAYPEVDFVD